MKVTHLDADGSPKFTNALIGETSPYLQQHAHNPVDWHPWSERALQRALRERKPILLSIGYSACHWCHVMADESFEDPETAQVMNDLFINIKVDREERPDIDRIYQIAQQLLTQRSGGWPLTMFLTHDDQRPFFGGTYFPKDARHGLPAFKDLLARVATYYREHETELRRQNAALISAFDSLNPTPAANAVAFSAAPLAAARETFAGTFDSRFGGFGGAPKFPHPQTLERLLRDWQATASDTEPDLHALYMSTLTLRRMGDGGINDQLGGGFCRYSVDEHWMIPHFEKMLYDNGALLAVYAQAAIATGDVFYAQVAARTADWTLREMQAPEGGYYSSLDADSEGHEGKFYVWDREEVRDALAETEYAVFAARFGLDREPNFEGKWHLHVFQSEGEISAQLKVDAAQIPHLLESARQKLLARRAARVRPGRDEKILTSWNALMIRGMAIASRALGRPDLAESATRALDFIRTTLWRNGRLLATYKDGRAHLNAYLDDYVFLAEAILELQQTRFCSAELTFARELLDVVLEHFADPEAGGFFFTSDDHETLIHRSKSFSDDATPAGNGSAAFVLQRMGHLLGNAAYLHAAERTLHGAWPAVEKYPHGHVSLLNALEELLNPPEIVLLRGEATEITAWSQELGRLYAPRRLILAVPADTPALPAALAEKTPRDRSVAYVCQGSVCSEPLDSLGGLVNRLRMGVSPGSRREWQTSA
ncbi:MAG TPA: thioredoxin domain-containing protein [Steroidobacteraceae bacterium]|nr:thioredoxin domain-containing protein [Steroidobacteraceae bacterium]